MLIIYVHGGMYLLINDIDRTKARSEVVRVSIILKPMTTFVARSRAIERHTSQKCWLANR
jgi:hypothetical protein